MCGLWRTGVLPRLSLAEVLPNGMELGGGRMQKSLRSPGFTSRRQEYNVRGRARGPRGERGQHDQFTRAHGIEYYRSGGL
jgi:hypothetical protein